MARKPFVVVPDDARHRAIARFETRCMAYAHASEASATHASDVVVLRQLSGRDGAIKESEIARYRNGRRVQATEEQNA